MNYIEAISIGFPGVNCHSVGTDDTYENIVYDSGLPVPSKETLDEWILSNQSKVNGTRITILAFRNRFTKTEKITIDLASIDNPAATMQQRQLAAAIRVDTKDSDNALYIDLIRPETIAGVNALEEYGIIAPGRANTILNTSVSNIERYLGS